MTGYQPGPIALLGSGETAAAGGRVFETLARDLPRGFRAAILETPAGFELNSERVAGRIATFAQLRLNSYAAQVDVIRARRRGTPLSPDDPAVTSPLLRAQMIFAGPGSPTYTVRQLSGALAWERVRAAHALGAVLIFASAGAIAIGRYALPVYEIYKAGHDLRWHAGLDLLGPFGLNLAVVSHWNNTEGGAELDTRYCFMGKDRFDELARLLPPDATIVGIDEHTALTIDLAGARAAVLGQGRITVIRDGRELTFSDGESFALGLLGPFRPAEPLASLPAETVAEALAARNPADEPAPDEVLALANARQAARIARDWARADQLRNKIEALGWQVQDTPDGPSLTPEAGGR
jgi:cyanophycinase-like exopeptidase